jgi:TolB protein
MRRDGTCQTLVVNVPGKPIAHPTWSPDSEQILFAANLAGTFDLWACGRDGSSLRQVTTSLKTEESPHWSLQGDLVAFDSELSGQWEIWATPANGGPLTQLTEWKGDNRSPVWSPDGRRLALVSTKSGNQDIWIVRVPPGLLPLRGAKG